VQILIDIGYLFALVVVCAFLGRTFWRTYKHK
jgi:hypothetical protein